MGSPTSEPGRWDNETQHQVTLSHGFWMLETQVTQEMWQNVMGNNPSHFRGAKLPVESVTWNDCQEYITKLNALLAGTPGAPAGYQFSLPAEAQWEYACRAGTTTAYSFGNMLRRDQANFGREELGGEGDLGRTTEVGSYPANAWGLHDMHGNVWEWVQDRFGNYPSGAVTDPTGAIQGSDRVIRGGTWYATAERCRSAARASFAPSDRRSNFGFRLSLIRADVKAESPPPLPLSLAQLTLPYSQMGAQVPTYCMHLAYAFHLEGRDAESRQYFDAARDQLTPFVPNMRKEDQAMYDVLVAAYP